HGQRPDRRRRRRARVAPGRADRPAGRRRRLGADHRPPPPHGQPGMNLRSLLFVPGTRTELLVKVPRWSPDVVIVDLEDAVPPAEKDAARRAVAEADFSATGTTVLVRINPPGTPWHELDIAACLDTAAAGIVLPKGEDQIGR